MFITSLQLYLLIGLTYGATLVAIAVAMKQPDMTALPIWRRIFTHLLVLVLGAIAWPLALTVDLRCR